MHHITIKEFIEQFRKLDKTNQKLVLETLQFLLWQEGGKIWTHGRLPRSVPVQSPTVAITRRIKLSSDLATYPITDFTAAIFATTLTVASSDEQCYELERRLQQGVTRTISGNPCR